MAASNNVIILNTHGQPIVRIEGTIDGTPKPGTIMQPKAATEPSLGRHTWTAYSRTNDGDRPAGPIAVLDVDELQGKTVDDAYASGSRGFMWVPRAGDEANILCLNLTGSGSGESDVFAIGDTLIIDSGTGKGINSVSMGTVQDEPFVVMETVASISADTLVHCMRC